MIHNKLFTKILMLGAIVMAACEEDRVKPTLPEPTEFVAPSFISFTTAAAEVFLPENADEEYETFIWNNSSYGIQVSVKYELEVDVDDNFTDPKVLVITEGSTANSTRWVSVTIEDMNDVMLSLGVPGFQKDTVYVRVKSTINGIDNDPLYSGAIQRIATTYQTSECGNFCTVGIIGSASPGGWGADTDMRLADPTKVDKTTWTVIVYLLGGQEVKFRAGDSWDTNWGATGFPTGTGTQNGPNIPIPNDGYYKVTFNDATGDYTFTAVSSSFTTIGIIGTATPGGWGSDTDLTQSGTDPHVWTGTVTLTAGEAKFRAENDWASNWGETTYPSGYGVGNGPNIAVPVGGTFFIYFNDATGEYMFGPVGNSTPYGSVGAIGPATPNGWGGPDSDLYVNPANAYKWSRTLVLTDGEAKFRADDDWAVNWGASTFPGGIGVQNGANIAVPGGTYFVTFNTITGEYYFLK